MNVVAVGQLLQTRSRDLMAKEAVRYYEWRFLGGWGTTVTRVCALLSWQNRHTLNEISEIRDFVKMLPEMQEEKRSLSKFVNMAEKVQEVSNSDEFHEQWSLERCAFLFTPTVCRDDVSCVGSIASFLCWPAAVLEKERTKEFAEYVETLISKREPVERVLKLLCLMCQTDDGISSKQFDQYRRDILQVQ
jgi:vacuolar protein sorting-associated protein 33A